jgi:predicted secreted protein
MKKVRIALAMCLLILPAFAIVAGDSAVFVNLGFSDKGDYFMFAQYGVSSNPYAETYIVETAKNAYVKNGTAKKSYSVTLQPGQDPAGALYLLIGDQQKVVSKYGINHLRQGRLLYLLMNGDAPTDTLNFRDFATNNSYSITMKQKSEAGTTPKSSFGIDVKRTPVTGPVESYTVGNPQTVRDGVKGYKIRRIVVSPDEKSLVFIIEKEIADNDGSSIRYMIETVPLK